MVVSGGGAGLTDPTLLTVSDMARAEGDNLIMRVRKALRQRLHYPGGANTQQVAKKQLRAGMKPWNITTIHTRPTGVSRSIYAFSGTNTDSSSGFRKCDSALGNACFVTGSMGLLLTSVVVNGIATDSSLRPNGKLLLQLNCSSSVTGNDVSGFISSNTSESTSCINTTDTPKFINTSSFSESSLTLISELVELGLQVDQELELVDAHCHIQLEPLYSRLTPSAALHRALSTGVTHVTACSVCPGEDWERLQETHAQYPNRIYPQYGLHPWYITKALVPDSADSVQFGLSSPTLSLEEFSSALEDVVRRFPQCGVGECGLDKSIRRQVSLQRQEEVLFHHLKIASQYNRPLTLHCVGSWGRLLELLQNSPYTPNIPALVLHSCNSMSHAMLQGFLSLPNAFFSFNGKTLNACPSEGLGGSNPRERESQLLQSVPLPRLLLESDSPDQLPEGLRDISPGNLICNEPAFVQYTCKQAARILDIDTKTLALITTSNCHRIFKL